MSHQPKQNDTGILIIIAILAILAAVVIPNVIGLVHRSAEMDKDLQGPKELRIEKALEGGQYAKQPEQLHAPLAYR